ncbi:hypothetical protein RS022_04990 [Candidatus Phytoplasma rubi]|uniref:Uncharacterized protein n=1 Tax=Candidatus Phytoplasma rubi TaxID=399025 RepID=A0ABY7BUA1_9MOLU|nr:hypothetical protein RS022_04990 [Candidatus Phytoplasma rubi]
MIDVGIVYYCCFKNFIFLTIDRSTESGIFPLTQLTSTGITVTLCTLWDLIFLLSSWSNVKDL